MKIDNKQFVAKGLAGKAIKQFRAEFKNNACL